MTQQKLTSKKLSILKSALTCFTRKGVEATTIDDIRIASNSSVGSIYHHFESKDGIAAALYKEGLRQFSQQMMEQLQSITHIEQMIDVIISSNLDWIVTEPDWARYIFQSRHLLKKTGEENKFKEETRTAMQILVTRATQLHDNHRLRKMPFELYHPMIIGPAHQYAKTWLSDDSQRNPLELKSFFVDAAIRSVLT